MPGSPAGIMTLTLEDAETISAGAIEAAVKQGIKIAVAVVDTGGRLVALERMDGAPWASLVGAEGKALMSSGFNISSGRLAGDRGEGHYRLFGGQGDSEHMLYLHGGVAVFRDNVAIGACGVAGGTGPQDEACARSGVAKLTGR